ncbi:MAG: tetratricopeptide repeat protein [Myxococcaceae bacterium]|nr:tetratricopeptide repeat protein [Myxococcaceae bacterium]MCA3015100.1 tetratricopeptide repeat protein [Myxococcaceae bacterium]
MSRVILLTTLASAVAFAQKNPDLERAQSLLAQRKYPDALKALEAAEKKGGLDRDSYLTLLESKGLALASTNKLEPAELAFRAVLGVDPRRELSGKYVGAVNKPIDAAKAWVAENGPISIVALEPGISGGQVTQLSLAVKNDPQRVVKAVKFYVRMDGGSWKPTDAALVNGAASLDLTALAADWWAELQDDRKNQVAFLGSALKPLRATVPAPVAAAPPPAPEKQVEPAATTPAPVATAAAAPPGVSGLRIAGYVTAGVGLATLGVGTFLGVSSNAQAEAIRAANVPGANQAVLFEQDQARIATAVTANVLFIAGAVLVAGGGVLWFLGAPEAAVAIVPMGPTGLAVTGRF